MKPQTEEQKHAVRLGKAKSDLLSWIKKAMREEQKWGKASQETLDGLEKERAIVRRLSHGGDW